MTTPFERQGPAVPGKPALAAPSPPPSRRARRRRLSSLGNVRNGLADVIRELEHGLRDPATGKALIYAYSVLAGVIQSSRDQDDFAKRLGALEARVLERDPKDRGGSGPREPSGVFTRGTT